MAESLQFSIGADTKNFTDGIGGAIGALAGLAAAFVSVQAIVSAFSDAIEMGGRLHDLSTRTGETAGNLAILERAFDNASVGADKLGPALNKMQKSMVDMQQGSKEAVEAFTQLGLTWADLEGKSPADQMQLIGIRLAAIEDPALRAETAMKIFGKSGGELIPILMNFSAETAQAKEQLGSLPGQLDASAAAVDGLGDNLSAIRNKLTEMAYGFLSEVVPAVEAFTRKIAGVDAASIGAGLADALVGAFADPMKAAGLLSDTLILGVKTMGNELIFQVSYWSDILFKTFSTISSDIIPILGNNMTGAFAMAVGTLGNALAGLLAPLADMLGLDFIGEMAAGSQDLLTQGAAKIAESANAFASAMAEAKQTSQVVRQDFFGVEGSSSKIAEDWAAIQQSGKAIIDQQSVFLSSGAPTPVMGAGINTPEGMAALERIAAAEKVNQTPVTVSTSGSGGKTAAQIVAEQQKQLGLIAGASSTQMIGQSASARRAIEEQKQLDQLVALGKGGTEEAASLATSIFRNQQIALGNTLTASDIEAAHQLALDAYFQGSTKGMTELESEFQANILEDKMSRDSTSAQMQKAKEAGAGGGKDAQKPVTMSSMVNTVIQILQKIEPKIPQHIMS